MHQRKPSGLARVIPEIAGLEQEAVRWQDVSSVYQEDIPHQQVICANGALLAAPHHPHLHPHQPRHISSLY